MSNIAFLFLPLASSSLPAVLPFVSPSSQVRYFGVLNTVESGQGTVGRKLGGKELETGIWGRELRTMFPQRLQCIAVEATNLFGCGKRFVYGSPLASILSRSPSLRCLLQPVALLHRISFVTLGLAGFAIAIRLDGGHRY